MPANPEHVNLAEVSAFIADALRLTRNHAGADPAELLVFVERKADLLTRIAERDGTDDTHAVARAAREQLARLRAGQSQPRAGGGA